MQPFEYALPIREKLTETVKSLSLEQLNKIPEGCNNNIAWHLGHIVVSTELLCYHRTGCKLNREIPMVEKYRNGTRPEKLVHQVEIDYLLSRLLVSLEEIKKGYIAGLFAGMKPYSTHTFGLEMHSIEEVFEACSHHDLLHAGCITIMKRLV
ncbi:MAG: DinB family protein [Edaphocola sp.]